MEPLDRTLFVSIVLAGAALVTAAPALGASAVGLLLGAALLSILVGERGGSGRREVGSLRVVEGGALTNRVEASGRLLAPALLRAVDRTPAIAEPAEPPPFRAAWGRFSIEDEVTFELPVRGIAEVGPLVLERLDPLALTRTRVPLARPEHVTVWPTRDDAREHPLRARFMRILAGEHTVRNSGSSLEFYGIREYLPGDPQRAVNWKATVRMGEMMVTQFEHETHGEFNVFLDNRLATGIGTLRNNPSHGVARTAATLGQLAWSQRDILQAFAFGGPTPHSFRPDPGSSWLDQFLDWLAELTPTGGHDAALTFDKVLARLTPRSMVVFVTPFVGGGDPLGDAPLRAAALENSVLVIASPLPSGLPEPIAQQLRTERRAAIGKARAYGIEILDLDREPSLTEALATRGASR